MYLKFSLLIVLITKTLQMDGAIVLDDAKANPQDFECTAVGSFPDPDDCQKYHVCQLTSTGDYWDIPLTCPDTTVWCQEKLRCESPVVCPCQTDVSTTTTESPGKKPKNCLEIQNNVEAQLNSSWSYEIFPFGSSHPPIKVRCDFETEGGGWTVVQQRVPGGEKYDFFKNWTDYEQGFGSTQQSYWLGLKAIHTLTSLSHQSLRIELGDWEDNFRFAKYDLIFVSSPDDLYRLLVSGYSGDAGDSLETHNQMKFSTIDQDHDNSTNDNCADIYKGSWWFNDCFLSDLNGPYYVKEEADTYKGIRWASWKDHSFRTVSMKIRDLMFT